jgi:hypothetical protein
VEDAQVAFAALLAQTVEVRGPRADAAMTIHKRVATYGLAAEGIADDVRFIGNEIALVQLATPVRLPRRWLGTGTFPHLRLNSLDELLPMLRRLDQTLTYFGFTVDEMVSFAQRASGRTRHRSHRADGACARILHGLGRPRPPAGVHPPCYPELMPIRTQGARS